MGAGLNGRVFALASEGTNVLAGGEFTGSGDTPLARVARWNGLYWEPVGESLPGAVTALLATNGVIYASWRTEPSRAVVGILRDGKWQTLSDSGVIRSMVFFEDSLFVGGSVGQGEMQIRSVAQLKDGVWKQPGQPLVSGFVDFTVIFCSTTECKTGPASIAPPTRLMVSFSVSIPTPSVQLDHR